MRKLIVVGFVGVAAALSACGPSQSTGGPASTPAQSGLVTTQQIAALAERVFPKATPDGHYGVCGVDGNVTACPYTDRLKARLTELRQTLARAQNLWATREITGEVMSRDAGIAHVKLFGGRQTLDLWVVQRGNALLVDDEICAGQKNTSIYTVFVACDSGVVASTGLLTQTVALENDAFHLIAKYSPFTFVLPSANPAG